MDARQGALLGCRHGARAFALGTPPSRLSVAPKHGPLMGGTHLRQRMLAARTYQQVVEARTETEVEEEEVSAPAHESGPDPDLAAAAMAAKIAAARELARRLTEERKAALMASKQSMDEDELRTAMDASAAAAAQAARADAVARALRSADGGREQLARLRAENENLKNLLLDLASSRDGSGLTRTRLETALMSSFVSGQPLSLSTLTKESLVLEKEDAALGAVLAPEEPAAPPTPTPSPSAAKAGTVAPPLPSAPTQQLEREQREREERAEREREEEREREREERAFFERQQQQQQQGRAAAAPAAAPATSAVPETAAAPPSPPSTPTLEQLNALASQAAQAGSACFTFPAGPVPAPGPMWLYYNRALGPLPYGHRLQLKMGTNKWEAMGVLDMTQAKGDARPTAPSNSDWWFVKLDLPDDIFKFDFVVIDAVSGLVDNNQYKDFTIPLSGVTEQELMERRIAALRQQEAARLQLLQEETDRLKEEAQGRLPEVQEKARQQARALLAEKHQAAARKLVQQLRPPSRELPAPGPLPNRTCWLGENAPAPGTQAQLAYNKGRSDALKHCNSVVAHVGFDGWFKGVEQVINMTKMGAADLQAHSEQLNSPEKGGVGSEWWVGTVNVPIAVRNVDWVISDRDRNHWDNNSGRDFHASIKGPLTEQQLMETFRSDIDTANTAADNEFEERMVAQAARKMFTKVDAVSKRLAAKHQTVYTVPSRPQAGQSVDVYYNPELTPLRGRPEVYVHCTWDRGGASNRHRSVVLQLTPERSTGGLGFQKGTIQLPAEAWGMDLTFRDTKEGKGGFHDDNGGLKYHFPLLPADSPNGNGSMTKARKGSQLSIVHVAVEMAPIAKVGGMGDVVTALGRAVQEEGDHYVEVLLPKFDCINYSKVDNLRQEGSFGWSGTNVRVWKGQVEQLPTTFLEPENGMFWVGCIYGRNDDHARFAFFCEAAMEYMRRAPRKFDIAHCHDWPTAPIAWAHRGQTRCVFTIHNLSYGMDLIGRAMASADVATTVSPTYAREISGHGAIAPHLSKLYGIRNGIDPELWDPQCDPFLPLPYGPDNVAQGKEAARGMLRQRLNLAQVDVPIVSVVTRLVAQKGIHLIKHAAWRTVERGGQFVLLGSAPDPRVQGEFNALKEQLMRQYHDRAALVFTYDEPLSHLIYAASDLFLVPSMFEPCGLTQMIAMMYGALPVVRRTGGLADTVFDLDTDEQRAAAAGMRPNGFVFEGTDTQGMDYGLNRALAAWFQDRQGFRRIQARVMTQDWSWFSPALDYVELYHKALRG